MSLDKSLKSKDTLQRHRNVLTRAERVVHLQEVGRWTDESSALGLPKVAHRRVRVAKKAKAAKTEGTAEAAAPAAPAAKEKK